MTEASYRKMEKERQKTIRLLRSLCLHAAILTPVINIVYSYFKPSYQYNTAMVVFFTVSFFMLYYCSGTEKLQKYLVKLSVLLFGFASISTIYFAYRNNYAYEYILFLLILTIALSLIFEKPLRVFAHNFIVFCMIFFTLLDVPLSTDRKILVLFSYAIFSVISYIGISHSYRIKRQLEISQDDAEQEKERNLIKYNQLFHSISQGIAILEAVCDHTGKACDFRFVEVNEGFEKLTGLKNSNITGRGVREVLSDIDFDWLEECSGVYFKKEHRNFERESKISNRNFDISAYPYEENKIGLLISDITAKVIAQEQLKNAIIKAEETNELKSRFLRNVTHELRTPMNSIMGLLQLLEMTELDDEQAEDLKLMKEESSRMLALINNIIYLIESEKTKADEKSDFDIRQLTETLIHQARLSLSDHVELICSFDEDIPEKLWGDSYTLRKILEELLGNAVKFTARGWVKFHGKIVRTYHGEPGTVLLEFSVEDTGIGIEEERLPFLFHEFTQTDETIMKKYSGTGIGLALCKNLAEKIDAVINVQSKPGKGSTFTLHVIMNTISQ